MRNQAQQQKFENPDLVEKGCSGEHHGEFTRVVGIVQPAVVVEVPGVETSREADNPLPRLSPNAATKHNGCYVTAETTQTCGKNSLWQNCQKSDLFNSKPDLKLVLKT